MTPTLAILIGIAVMALAFFGWALCRVSAQADRRAQQDYLLSPYDRERPCVVCGAPVDPPTTLHGRIIHPGCRSDVA